MNISFPKKRMRRNRMTNFSRDLVRENTLSIQDLIYPIFIVEGTNKKYPIESMPDTFKFSTDLILHEAERAYKLGIRAIALFPNIDLNKKDKNGSEAINPDNLVCRTVSLLKEHFPDLGIICDVALDPYTTHGHDGLLINNEINNDKTINVLCKQAVNQANAGCDIIAPSDMMDGRVGIIRDYLDKNGFINTQIMAYSAKYASSFYGPFRDAVGSKDQLKFDKKSYQMDPANGDEAILEVNLDISEGADMVIVKPGMPYLDIIYRIKKEFKVPTYAFQVSGEYSMIMSAKNNIYMDLKRIMLESLLSFKRAGANGVITYFAMDAAEILKKQLQ